MARSVYSAPWDSPVSNQEPEERVLKVPTESIIGKALLTQTPVEERAAAIEAEPRGREIISHYALAATLTGLVIGIFDSFYCYRFPRPRVLLQPDVSYVLFFGSAAGWAGSRGPRVDSGSGDCQPKPPKVERADAELRRVPAGPAGIRDCHACR